MIEYSEKISGPKYDNIRNLIYLRNMTILRNKQGIIKIDEFN